MTIIESPKQLSLILIHKINKDYLRVTVTKSDDLNTVEYTIYKSRDGFHDDELMTDGIFSKEAMPKPVSEIYNATVTLTKYIKKNGYKTCNTIVQGKNGTKLK